MNVINKFFKTFIFIGGIMRKIKRNYTPEELYNDYIVSNLTRKQISEKYS